MYTVYRISCSITGESYVGKAKNYKQRMTAHRYNLKSGFHSNHLLQDAYNTHGKDSFKYEILEQDITLEMINEREVFWVKYYNSYFNGFNLTFGGNVYFGIPYIVDKLNKQQGKD